MERRAFLSGLTALGALPVLSSCALVPGSGPNPAAQAAGTGNLTIGMIPVAHFSATYLAQRAGLLKREGLSVSVQIVQNAASIVPSVLNGQLAIGTGSGTPFLNAVSRNVPIRAVAPAANNPSSPEVDTLAVVAQERADLQTIADLAGKTVALNAIGSQPHIALSKLMMDAGQDPDSISLAPMPMADAVAAVQQGRVDAAAVAEPFVTIAQEQGLTNFSPLYSVAFGGNGVESVFYAADEVIAARRDELDAFSTAIREAAGMMNADPQLSETILTEDLNMDPAIAQRMVMPELSSQMTTDTLGEISQVMVETGFLLSAVSEERMVP